MLCRVVPLSFHSCEGSSTTSESRVVSGTAVPSSGNMISGMLLPFSNSCCTIRFISAVTSSSSSEARRSFTTFFKVGLNPNW